MFSPSRDDVRRFFCDVWRKHREQSVLTPLEAIALDWIRLHPEYHDDLADAGAAVARQFSIDGGQTNPFLHLSMHLAIAEQLSVDQPPGIRAEFDALAVRHGNAHDAAHDVMECLGQVMWRAQRSGGSMSLDELNDAYLTCLRQRSAVRR